VLNLDLTVEVDRSTAANGQTPSGWPKHSEIFDPGWRVSITYSWQNTYDNNYGRYRTLANFVCSFQLQQWTPPVGSYIIAYCHLVPFKAEIVPPICVGTPSAPNGTATLFSWIEDNIEDRPSTGHLRLTLHLHIPGSPLMSTNILSAQVVSHLIKNGHTSDIKFTAFSRRRNGGGACAPKPIFGVRDRLLGRFDAFDDLLRAEGFSQHATGTSFVDSQTYGYDSDSDLEDEDMHPSEIGGEEDPDVNASSAAPTSPDAQQEPADSSIEAIRSVIVNDGAFVTWHAFLFHLHGGHIEFAPLRSSGIEKRQEFIRTYLEKNPDCPSPCSPKSMFRLAEKYGVKDLQEMALQAIRIRMTSENVVAELFSPISVRYRDVHRLMLRHLQTHKQAVKSDCVSRIAKAAALGEPPDTIIAFLGSSFEALLYPGKT